MKTLSSNFKPKTFLHASVLLFICGNLATLIQFVFQSIMRRGLPTGDFSLMNSIFGLVGIVTLPMAFLAPVMARKWAELRARGEIGLAVHYFWRATLISVGYGILISLILLFQVGRLESLLNTANAAALHAFIWGLLLMQLVAMASYFLQGMQAFGLIAVAMLVTPLVRLFFGDLWIKAGWGASAGVWATNLQNVVMFFVLLWFMARHKMFGAGVAEAAERTGRWRMTDIWVPALSLTILCILVHTDFVLVRHFFTPAEADRFATAALFGHSMIFFLQPISSVLLPKVVDQFEGWQGAERAIARRALAFSFVLAVAMAFVGTLLAEPVLRVFAGKTDPETLHLVRWFLWAIIPSALATICLNALVGRLQGPLILVCLAVSLLFPILIVLYHAALMNILAAHLITGVLLLGVIIIGNLGRLKNQQDGLRP